VKNQVTKKEKKQTSCKNKKNFNLTVLHWNCNVLKSKIGELETYLLSKSPDIVSLSEIKCNNYEAIFNLNMLHYNSIFKIRNDKQGREVALLINKKLKYEELNLDEAEEIVGINLKTNKKKNDINIFSYYNAPDIMLNKDLFDKIEKNYDNYLVCGDFNSKSLVLNCKNQNQNCTILEEIIINNNCQILNNGNTEPTFHIKTMNTDYDELLDFFIGSPLLADSLNDYEIINHPLLASDHSPIQVDFTIGNKILINESTNKILKNYTKAKWNKFNEMLNEINNDKYNNLTIIDFYDEFKKDINNSIEKNIPNVIFNNDGTKNNALPAYIIEMIKNKDKFKSNYAKHGLINDQMQMYKLKEDIKIEIVKNKQAEMINFLNKLEKTPVSTFLVQNQ
jgi:hypothetical protein